VNVAGLLGLPRLDQDLDRLEEALRGSVGSEDPFLSEVAGHLVAAGGKRLRPALTVAAAAAGGAGGDGAGEEVLRGGVSVELVHLGSLYHDDVMDEALTRRNVESVNARWGNLVAIVAGDFLLARASELAASLGTEVAGLLAATIARLCEGQVLEVRSTFDPGRTEPAYLASIAGKTAALMASACRIGALTAGLARDQVDAVTAFGSAFGMVFQIRDDILDVAATDAALGKPTGQDLVQGVYTLPVLRALGDPDVGPELRALLGSPLQPGEREKARAMVRSTPALESSLATARAYAGQAGAAARRVGRGPVVDAMAELGHRILDDLPI